MTALTLLNRTTMVFHQSNHLSKDLIAMETVQIKPSVVSDDSTPNSIPEVSWDDIRVGRILGKGSFSKVKEVTFRSQHWKQDKQQYAIKFLRNSTRKNERILLSAAVDLAMEAQLLSYLRHANIITLYAQGCLMDACETNDTPHFLILDRIYGTLGEKLDDWRFFETGEIVPFMFASRKRTTPLQRIRKVALPIARALEYLHSEQIVFRDVKPTNVGFSRDDTVKLFDFGLARIVKDDRHMTGHVGSPLYMSPELVEGRMDYGLPVDVYAFSLLLWELVTLNTPFEGMDRAELEQIVTKEGLRPLVDKNCGSLRLQELLKSGWAYSPESRPAFSTICKVLDDEEKFGNTISSRDKT